MLTETTYSFGPFSLNPARRLLLEDGAVVPLGARAFDLLTVLVENRDRTLPKDELIRRVWSDSTVEENNLTVTVSMLRKALREQRSQQRYVATVTGRGYRFVAPVASSDPEPVTAVLPTTPGQATLAEMPCLVVLPFANMSEDPGQEHFADGITEDIISELSRNRWLSVIARQTSFALKGATADIAAVARQLGVRYVLEGSVRKSGDRVRVTMHLVDAANNAHLVSERYDRELADIFAVQDDISALITAAVRPALYEAEQTRSLRKRPGSIDAWAAYQRGVWYFSRHEEPATVEAKAWFERAIELDPRFAPGYYGLALVYLHDGSAFEPNAPENWQQTGERLAMQAVLLDERDSGAHSVLGTARMVRGDHTGSLEAAERARALNPSDATAHGTAGATLVFIGRPLEGLRALAISLRLSPRDPRMRIRRSHVALGHYFANQLPEAEEAARFIIRHWPEYFFGPRMLAMVLAEMGRIDEAQEALRHAMALSPEWFQDFSHARMPWYRPNDHARMARALAKAGFDPPRG